MERSALHAERRRLGLGGEGEPDFGSGVYATSGFATWLWSESNEINEFSMEFSMEFTRFRSFPFNFTHFVIEMEIFLSEEVT